MPDLREQWLNAVLKWKKNPDGPPDNDRYWSEELETAPREKLKEIQEEKLRVVVKYVYEYSPFYREKFQQAKLLPSDIKSLEDLHKIPVTTRDEMARDINKNPPWGTYSCIDHDLWTKRGWMAHFTSGTTATPRGFRRTIHDRDMCVWNGARDAWAVGIRPGDSVMMCVPMIPHVYMWTLHYGYGLLGIPVIHGGAPLPTEKRILFIQAYNPTVLQGTPSYFLYLGDLMIKKGIDPAETPVRLLVVGGEPGACIPATKARLEKMWGAKVADLGGFNESPAGINFSCREEMEVSHRPMNNHLWEVQGIPEVSDPKTYEPLPDGKRGVFVWTDLYQESCPLLRFVVGDWIELNHAPCTCGRTCVLAVGGLLGRADELINIRGNLIYPSAVEEIVRGTEDLGDEYQLIITKKDEMDELTLVVEVREEILERDWLKLKRTLQEALFLKFDIRVNIELKSYNTLPRTEMKGQRIIDKR